MTVAPGHSGLAGQGGSSYIDLVLCRDHQFDYEEDPPVAVRDYVLQNWRADVVALAAPDGDLLERVTYDPYGIPFATHPTDLTFGATSGVSGYGMPNGTVNGDDYSYFLALYAASDWRADWNRDGTLSSADNTAFLADYGAATGSWGRGVLSNRSNILGYAGYVHEPATGAAGAGHGTMWHVRFRMLHSGLGRWVQRGLRDAVEFTSLLGFDPLSASTSAARLPCVNATHGCVDTDPSPVPILIPTPPPLGPPEPTCRDFGRQVVIGIPTSHPYCAAMAIRRYQDCCEEGGSASDCTQAALATLANCHYLLPMGPTDNAVCKADCRTFRHSDWVTCQTQLQICLTLARPPRPVISDPLRCSKALEDCLERVIEDWRACDEYCDRHYPAPGDPVGIAPPLGPPTRRHW